MLLPHRASVTPVEPLDKRSYSRGAATGRPELTERMIEADGTQLCTEAFGDPTDSPILLVMGLGASMLWWDEDFCRMLAEGGRFVIRYDHRDTGRSDTSEPGRPEYTSDDLAGDAAAVLDAYAIPAAHLVGVSAGAGIAQLLSLDFPDRVLSLVLISTSPALDVARRLPAPTEELGRFMATAKVDHSDPESVSRHLVDYQRVLTDAKRQFDETAARDLAHREVERASNIASAQNHDVLGDAGRSRPPLSAIDAPTLVIHGTADPMFPIEHGEALAEEIPGARLLPLEGAGHGAHRADWEMIVGATLEHTATDP
jgi:pimeloyl-ACP methyl ester carboxylesterase